MILPWEIPTLSQEVGRGRRRSGSGGVRERAIGRAGGVLADGDRRVVVERSVQVWRASDPQAIIKEIQVRYRAPDRVQGEGTFWKPLDWFEADQDTGPIKALFPPWLVLYVLVYVPLMLTAKAVLRVA